MDLGKLDIEREEQWLDTEQSDDDKKYVESTTHDARER
jgi:hypothetical protein